MSKSSYCYECVSVDGSHYFSNPMNALQHAVFMESVGADSVFYLCYNNSGMVKRLKRMSAYGMTRAIRFERRSRVE